MAKYSTETPENTCFGLKKSTKKKQNERFSPKRSLWKTLVLDI